MFRKFVKAARFYDANLLILGGDLTGKAMTPIVHRPNGRVEAMLGGRVQSVDESNLPELEQRIRVHGFYPFPCNEATYERLWDDVEFRERVFTDAMIQGLERWVAIADERLAGSEVQCFVMPGNDDDDFFEDVIATSSTMMNHDGIVIDLGDVQLLGLGPSNLTPWRTHRELTEEELSRRLNAIREHIDADKPLIVNTHVPPYGTGIDAAPQLREDFSIVVEGGEPKMIPVGSHAVLEFLHEVQPFVSLHGHIHESRGAVRVGRTLALNPGSQYSNGILCGAIVTIEEGAVLSYQLVTG